ACDLCVAGLCGRRGIDQLRDELSGYVPPIRQLCRPDHQGCEACGLACSAGNQVRTGDQHRNGPDAWGHNPAHAASPGGRGDRMRRREFITLLGGAAAAWPLAARAQQTTSRTIGWFSLRSADTDSEKSILTAFRQGLSQTGYVEGRNLTIEF